VTPRDALSAGSSHSGPAIAARGPRRRFRSLASRLVALGVVQLVLLAFTAAVIFIAEGPHEAADPEDQLTPAAIARLEHLIDTPAALNDALDELHAARVEVSLYDETRQLIASNVDPPLAIPPWPPRRGHRPPADAGHRQVRQSRVVARGRGIPTRRIGKRHMARIRIHRRR